MGIVVNYSGKGKYLTDDTVENVIGYITRSSKTSESRKHELIVYGAPNVLIYGDRGIKNAIFEFKAVQTFYHGKYLKGPKVHHESFNLTEEEAYRLGNNVSVIDEFAMSCARYFALKGHQVVYAVHHSNNKGLHIHFVCNAVSFVDGLKWHCSIMEQKEREDCFNQLLQEFICRINQQYLFPMQNFYVNAL